MVEDRADRNASSLRDHPHGVAARTRGYVGEVLADLNLVNAVANLRFGVGTQIELLFPSIGLLPDVVDRPERPDVATARRSGIQIVAAVELLDLTSTHRRSERRFS